MPAKSALRQTATYWAPAAKDKYGKYTFAAPEHIAVRWEDKQVQIINKEGENVVSKSRVYTLDQIDMNGYLALGTRTDTDPSPLDDAFEVQQISTTPDLRSLQALVTVYL